MLQMKQDTLAQELGSDWNQKKISLLEAKEEVEPSVLEQLGRVLKVPVEAIESFDDQAVVNIISNTIHDEAIGYDQNCKFNFNPIDKIVELYEALIKSEQEKVVLLQKMLERVQ